MSEKLPESSSVPRWIMVFGALMGGIVLLFFMALVFIEIMGHSIPINARFLVVCVLAIGMAFAFAAMGGSAVASGVLPLPAGIDSPIKFALGGGIATFAVVLIMGHLLYVRYGPVDITESLKESKIQYQKALAVGEPSSREEIKQGLEGIRKAEKELSYGQVTFSPAKAPPWLTIALQEKDKEVKEIPGPDHNPRIIQYLRTVGLPESFLSDETPWNSAFVNWCFQQSGIKGTNRAMSRSWLDWGEPLEKPRLGAITVLGVSGSPTAGHVGFYIGESATQIYLLGGNQANMVNISAYSKDRVLGYRWPTGVK